MSGFRVARDRDAWATIRGFVYQIELTIQRWLRLDPDHDLELEAGEDIDLVARAWEAGQDDAERLLEQVKHREGSVTLRSPEALAAIAAFAEHRTENPGRKLQFRFVTNAEAGRERPSPIPHSLTGIAAWEAVRTAAIPERTTKATLLEGIRQLLRTGKRPADLNEATWKHLEVVLSAQDDSLETLVADFQWSMRQAASSDLASQLQSELRSLGVASDERVAEYQFFRLFLHVTKLLCSRGTKRLTAADRDTLLRLPVPDAIENVHLLVVRDKIETLHNAVDQHEQQLQVIARHMSGVEDQLRVILGKTPVGLALEAPPDFSVPIGVLRVARRSTTVQAIRAGVLLRGWTALYGGSGAGKTELAILVAASLDAPPCWVRLRDLKPDAAAARLRQVARELGADLSLSDRTGWYGAAAERLGPGRVVVLDDLPRLYASEELTEELIHAVTGFESVGAHLLTTSTDPPPQSILDRLGARLESLPAPALTEDEVGEVLTAHEAPAPWLEKGARRVICRRTGGHPLLVVRAVRSLADAGWPPVARIDEVVGAFEVDPETLRRLLATVPQQDRLELLRRLTLIVGPFGLDDVGTVAAVAPEIGALRQHLDGLSGIWLQLESKSRYLVSPLLRGLGETELTPTVRRSVHEVLAAVITARKTLDVFDVLIAVHHLRRAEAQNRAAALLCWALHEVRALGDRSSVKLILMAWLHEPLPREMLPGLRLYLRSLQVAAAGTVGMRIDWAEAEIAGDVNTGLAAEEAWAVIASLIIAAPTIAKHDFSRASGIFLAALRHLPTAQLPLAAGSIAEALPFPLEQWIWQLASFVSSDEEAESWFSTLASMKPNEISRAMSTHLCPPGCMAVADRIWVSEADKPEPQRRWDRVDALLCSLAERATALGLETLWAWIVRARIVVIADYTKRLDDALALGKQALSGASQTPAVQFALHQILGTEYHIAGNGPEARKHLEIALARPVEGFPVIRVRARFTLSAAVGLTDRSAAVAIAEQAVAEARAEPGLPEMEVIRGLGELAIAQWLSKGVAVAFPTWDEAAERLLAIKTPDASWRALFMIFGHINGYFLSLAATGEPLSETLTGEVYAAPHPTLFLGYREEASRGYDESKFVLLLTQLSMLAEAVGRDDRAAEWALRGLDTVDARGDVASTTLLAPKVAIQLAAADRFGVAIDIGLMGGVAAVEGMRTAPDSASEPPGFAVVKGEDAVARRRRAEHIAANLALVPIALRLARMWLDRPAEAAEGADEAITACRLIGGSAADPALWNTAAQLFEEVFRHRTSARELNSQSAKLAGMHGTSLPVVAYVGASIQGDLRLEEIVRVHWEILIFLRAQARAGRVDRVLFLPLVETVWRKAIVEQCYRFFTPTLTAERFEQAAAAPLDARAEEILRAIAAGLGIALRKP